MAKNIFADAKITFFFLNAWKPPIRLHSLRKQKIHIDTCYGMMVLNDRVVKI
jgi:hypothetical protein